MGGILNKLRKLVIFVAAACFFCNAAYATEISIPAQKAKAGQTITVPIMIDQVDNLAGVKLVITYDKQVLTFKKAAKTKHTNSLMHIVNNKKPGLLIAVMAGAQGIKGKDFPIFILTFQVGKDLKSKRDTDIKITEVQLMSDKLKDIHCKIKIAPLSILPDVKASTS